MIEIFNCIYLIIFFLILFRLQFIDKLIEKHFNIKNVSLIEKYSINILLIFIILLFFSFFNFNNVILIFALFFVSLLTFFLNIKKNIKKNFINKDIFIIFIFTFIISINLVANLKLGWDGYFWYFKALNFYEDLSFFNLGETPIHPAYPHLGGVIWGLFWKISFLDYEFFGRMIYIFVYVISVLLIAEKITDNINLKLLFILILFFFTFDQYLFSGYQEYLLFGLIIIIFNLLTKFDLKKLNYFNIFFLISSSYLLVWVKNEGIFYFSAIILYIIYFQPIKKKLLFIFIFSTLIFIRMILFLKITGSMSIPNLNIDFLKTFDFSFSNFIFEILLISKHTIIAFFKYPIWLLIFTSLFLKKLDKKEIHIIYFAFFSFIFTYAVFLNSQSNLVWHLSVTLDRILLHMSAFFMIFLSLRLRYFCNKFIK